MRTTIILLLFTVISFHPNTKSECNYIKRYHPNSIMAEIEYYSGNYQEAFNHYEKAFKNCEPLSIGTHNDIFKFAEICSRLDKVEMALDFIEKSINNGYKLEAFTTDSIFDKCFDTNRGVSLLNSYENIREKYLSSLNLNLRNELQQMRKLDQELSGIARDSIFRINELRLVEIFEEFGYPNEQVVGPYNIDRISADPQILLLHTDDSIRINYFIPKIKEFISIGTCPPNALGTLYDNLEIFNNNPQTHGTYKKQNGEYSDMISSIIEVNKNRIDIGLPTLELTQKKDSLVKSYYGY